VTALGLSLVLLVGLTAWRFRSDAGSTIHDFVGPTMGTSYAVRVDADLTAAEQEQVAEMIRTRLDDVDGLMSTYDPKSQLSDFNRLRTAEPYPISGALLDVLAAAGEVSARSGGAFDVTVAPLVNAWGFGPGGAPDRAPDRAQLEALRARLGYERIVLDRATGTVSKTTPGIVIDLSAIAKGYAVDRVAAGLKELGLGSFLVEIGGELRAGAAKRDGAPWSVGVERPDIAGRRVHATLGLVDRAMATSGDYRSVYEENGVLYAHIIDPRTGMPIRHSGASVTVVHANGAMADGWATALAVLGPQEGYDLALREDLAALFVMRSDDGFRSRATPTFLESAVEFTEVGAR
jgi:thiamine biosynthesis lipoprotein